MKKSILSGLLRKSKNPGDEPYMDYPELHAGNSSDFGGDRGEIPYIGNSGEHPYKGNLDEIPLWGSPGNEPLRGGQDTPTAENKVGVPPMRKPGVESAIRESVSREASNDPIQPHSSPKPCGPGKLRAIGILDLMDMELPERRLLISPWLPERGIAMIYASRGIGKTFLALEIALAVASGGKFLNWEAAQAEKVLYLDGEMSLNDLQARLRKMDRGRKKLFDKQNAFISPEMLEGPSPDLSVPLWHRELAPYADRAKLIIVDNISTLCRTGNENDADSWQIVQQWAIQQKSAGRTVLFIHHAGKGGQQRGTSKREDVMDTVIALKRPSDYTAKQGARFEVHFEKSRGFSGDDAEPFVVQLNDEGDRFEWSTDNLEETTYQRVSELLGLGMTQAEISEELQVHKSTVSRHAQRVKDEGGI